MDISFKVSVENTSSSALDRLLLAIRITLERRFWVSIPLWTVELVYGLFEVSLLLANAVVLVVYSLSKLLRPHGVFRNDDVPLS